MTAATWGAAGGGFGLWLIEFLALSAVVERTKRCGKESEAERRRTIRIIRGISLLDLVLYPVVGWFGAPILVDLIA